MQRTGRRSAPPEGEVKAPAPTLEASLLLVTRRHPARRGLVPDARAFRRELKLRGADNVGQRPGGIVLDVCGKAEGGARLEHTRELPQRRGGDKAALVMARLGPGIGVEEVGRIQARIGEL